MPTFIGIIEQDCIGTDIFTLFEKHFYVDVLNLDSAPKSTIKTIPELCKVAKLIFLCFSDLIEAEKIVYEIDEQQKMNTVVIRSPIQPGTTKRLENKTSPNLRVINNLEIPLKDHIIVGSGNGSWGARALVNAYKQALPLAKITVIPPTAAEILQCSIGSFEIMRKTFMNEIEQICIEFGVDFSDVERLMVFDRGAESKDSLSALINCTKNRKSGLLKILEKHLSSRSKE